MERCSPWRTFLAAFVLTLCVLGLLCAFFVIECHIQQTAYGQVDLGVTYTMQDGVPAVQVDSDPITAPPALAQAAQIVTPPPVKLLAALWQWETEAAEWLWETLA